jgi:hypothetical protein
LGIPLAVIRPKCYVSDSPIRWIDGFVNHWSIVVMTDKSDRQDEDGLRTFNTAGTTLRRTVNVFTITCESAEIADRVADQLRNVAKSRGAAEGAGKLKTFDPRDAGFTLQDCGCRIDECEGRTDGTCHIPYLEAATPKPTPPVMRERFQYDQPAPTMRNPTEVMLKAARDWSIAKYGKGIGNDAAIGCWQAMFDALDSAPVPPADGVLGITSMLADERVGWRNDLHKRAADRDLEKRTIDLSPSPAVAAEPDDDWWARSERSYIDNTKRVQNTFYSILSRSIPSDMIDTIWQDLKEAGVVT